MQYSSTSITKQIFSSVKPLEITDGYIDTEKWTRRVVIVMFIVQTDYLRQLFNYIIA